MYTHIGADFIKQVEWLWAWWWKRKSSVQARVERVAGDHRGPADRVHVAHIFFFNLVISPAALVIRTPTTAADSS